MVDCFDCSSRDIPGRVVRDHVHHHTGVQPFQIDDVFQISKKLVNRNPMKTMRIIIDVDTTMKKNQRIIILIEMIDMHVEMKDDEMIINVQQNQQHDVDTIRNLLVLTIINQ